MIDTASPSSCLTSADGRRHDSDSESSGEAGRVDRGEGEESGREEGREGEEVGSGVCGEAESAELPEGVKGGYDPNRFRLLLERENKKELERRRKDAKTLPLVPVAEVGKSFTGCTMPSPPHPHPHSSTRWRWVWTRSTGQAQCWISPGDRHGTTT